MRDVFKMKNKQQNTNTVNVVSGNNIICRAPSVYGNCMDKIKNNIMISEMAKKMQREIHFEILED